MLTHIAHWVFAFALALAAHATIPGWTPAASAASAEHKKTCKSKTHRHGKVAAAKPSTKAAARGSGGAQIRRVPEIQILTFGP